MAIFLSNGVVTFQSQQPSLSHLDGGGAANMVDVADKPVTQRVATAEGYIRMTLETLEAVQAGDLPKGDVLGTARLAGIMAAKQTSNLIPLCHPLPINKVQISIEVDYARPGYRIEAMVKTTGQTGVEMEALTAVAVTSLTLYDMAKALQKSMQIEDIRLLAKTGGKSGDYTSDS
ncbi:MAG: cyclic pyranopterin monophosphate synthase MoaC [Cyanobacteria bacterium P01_H01_bin.21]